MKLSVIIVNYNGRQLLPQCLASVAAQVPVDHEIIVVDNNSADGSVEYLQAECPNVKLIRSGVNLGFAGGNLLGAQAAIGKFLLLLNSDAIVTSSVAPLIALMDGQPEIGALGCQLRYADGSIQESIGFQHTLSRVLLAWLPLRRVFPARMCSRTMPRTSNCYLESCLDVDWVSGAFLLTPAAVWKAIGGLDDQYFMYVEDADYCLRLRTAGCRVVFSALACATHLEGAGRAWIGRRALLNTAFSYLTYARKFFPRWEIVLLRTLLPTIFGVRSLYFLGSRWLTRNATAGEKGSAYLEAAWIIARGGKGHV